ncbi:DEAD/DEAH box helicase [Desulfocurvibacter africanus]|uniref:DEAD/DEAH box helicase n=1 Tax=Desulfocurvibacter africanus TaxID=873 RepID=UPI000417A0DA|nr:DEAD/DEAH box helicase [Desulfocurvibacter africanus]
MNQDPINDGNTPKQGVQPSTEEPIKAGGSSAVTQVEPDEGLKEMTLEMLPPLLREALSRAGWTSLMPVQAKSMPIIMGGHDLMVQSRTGSGKTGAFVLPILERIDPNLAATQALVLVPTRELARQVAHEAEVLVGDRARVVAVYGGVSFGKQVEGFKAGAHIVVGTPGRILDHLLRHNFNLQELRALIFDEADRMLSIGFYPDMKQVQRYMPKRRVNTFMFSATYPAFVMRLAGEFMHKPQMLSLSSKQVHVAEVQHVIYEVPRMGRERCLMRIIEVENPTSAFIFCNTKAQVEYVSTVLANFGYDADGLTGDLSQSKRESILDRVRAGSLRLLVSTDVAARGIDIPDLSHVIMYEPPEDPESYIHRAGRTGRAGASGEVITLVDVIQKLEMQRLAKRFTIDLVTRPLPTDETVRSVASERVTALLESTLRARPPLKQERMMRFMPLAQELGKNEEELAIIAMLLDDYYQQTLHSPPELPVIRQSAPRTEPVTGHEPASAHEGEERKKRRRPRNRHKKSSGTDNRGSDA